MNWTGGCSASGPPEKHGSVYCSSPIPSKLNVWHRRNVARSFGRNFCFLCRLACLTVVERQALKLYPGRRRQRPFPRQLAGAHPTPSQSPICPRPEICVLNRAPSQSLAAPCPASHALAVLPQISLRTYGSCIEHTLYLPITIL